MAENCVVTQIEENRALGNQAGRLGYDVLVCLF
jgi:hypothetical protein